MMTKLTELPWESRFVEQLPGDPEARNFTRGVRHACYSEVRPTPVRGPRLLGWAAPFAEELGLSGPSPEGVPGDGSGDSESLELLAGNRVLPGMRPYAARYGGHQFGQWAGQLGDGRAITLGEAVFPRQGRLEFQLKGAGPTPYSRRADGRAVLRSSLREFLCGEAMHALGVPTTRALSLVTTGEAVVRDMFYDGNPAPEPGAVVCRVAPTFLRFGNFEIHAAYGEYGLLRRLADYLIVNYYPELDAGAPDVYGQLLDEVARRTAETVAHWQRVGFVHGVMNTDNMSMLGLTLDYGPYGWLEPYDPTWTPNTTDAAQGRYRFANQPAVALWNLGRLGSALFPLIDDEDRIRRALDVFRETFQRAHGRMLAAKLGLSSVESEADGALVADLFELLGASETDYTLFFRGLSGWAAQGQAGSQAGADAGDEAGGDAAEFLGLIAPAFYGDAPGPDLRRRWAGWSRRYAGRVRREAATDAERTAGMKKVNPKFVPRNYLAQDAIVAAGRGDLTVLGRLMRVLRAPYDEQPGEDDLAARRPEWARRAPGCSALSCSS